MVESATTSAGDMTAQERHLRLRRQAATPADRLAAMRGLIERSWAMLRRNPRGLAHFRSRNFRARALAVDAGRTPHDA